ncbi:hypothetical protein FO519_001404 [Halicephalobus sp. NKZ332]|nr:hypothetical protein FO519_001404 [Halicephalobus sp. NKZ332]
MTRGLIQLLPGTEVGRWTIEDKLGEGSFGVVYKVRDSTDQYALKLEGIHVKIQVLKMEAFVLIELAKKGGRHFCKIEDKGRCGGFNYVVMTLVGRSLQDLLKELPDHHMSMGTAISVGIGYLHRDVKPSNYTIGRVELGEQRKIYILDFGMCRRFTNDQGFIRRPRVAAGFRGTVRYAPVSCHLQRELCRKDDIETWIYMLVELTTGNLPWKNIRDINFVGEYKLRCRNEDFFLELFCGCPYEFVEILRYVDSLKYYDTPNYRFIYSKMRQAIASTNLDEFPYDWEKPGMFRKPEIPTH